MIVKASLAFISTSEKMILCVEEKSHKGSEDFFTRPLKLKILWTILAL